MNFLSEHRRYLIALLCLSSAMMSYIGRINLSTAIVEMVNNDDTSNNKKNNEFYDACLESPETRTSNITIMNKSISTTAEKFSWNQKTQGVILGSFFYGYFALQLIGGRLAESFGPRYLCTAGLFVTGLINLLTPLITSIFGLFVASRIVLGAFQAAIYPCCYALTTRWIPDHERSLVNSMAYIGGNSGTIIASMIAGYLSKHGFAGGWPSVFYVSGITIILFSVVSYSLIRDYPHEHWMMSEKELKYIESNIKSMKQPGEKRKSSPVPWKKIFTNRTILAGVFAHFTMVWSLTVIILKLPDYMNRVLAIPLEKNGMFTSVMYLSEGLSLFLGGFTADRIIKTGRFKKTTVRKIFQIFAQIGGSVCLLLVPLANCDSNLFLIAMISMMTLNGLQSGGLIPLPSDISNEFSATIFGLFNMIAMTNGFIGPLIIGFILDYDQHHPKHQWWIVIYITVALRIAGGLVFILFVSTDRQNWQSSKTTATTTSSSLSSLPTTISEK